MKLQITLLASTLMLSLPIMAKNDLLSETRAIADEAIPAVSSHAYDLLKKQSLEQLRNTLKGDAATLVRYQFEDSEQNGFLADKKWLNVSGYDFQVEVNQKAGIDLLSSFNTLPKKVVQEDLDIATTINHDAGNTSRNNALVDAEGVSYLYFISDALGPRLGKAFLSAYDKGELGKAAALIKASEVGTRAAKKYFNRLRPYQTQGNVINLVPDDVVVKDNKPYTTDGSSFPSGHTNTGYTDALLMAEMIPERFDALVIRGAFYGYSRIVLGVHYPLDVIGGRMLAQRNVAQYLNDTKYRELFNEARDQLRIALENECGTTLDVCAKVPAKDDPYHASAMRDFYRFTMNYGLPQKKDEKWPLKVPEGAEVLLERALPNLSAAQRRNLMVKTALPAGYPLSGETEEQQFWQRLNLPAAYQMGKLAGNSH